MLLDSNIFLELQLDQKHADACERLLGKLRDGTFQGVITDFHLDSVIIIIEKYGKGWKDIATFLMSLLSYKGLKVYGLGLSNRIRATSLMRDYGLDFDDALAIQALKELAMETIISYDKDFDAVEWVRRKTPEALLQGS